MLLKSFYFFFLKRIETLKIRIIQNRYYSIIFRIKKKYKKGEPARIAFFITQKQLWNSHSVYENLLINSNFDPIIVVFPNLEDKINSKAHTLNKNYDFFINSGYINVIKGYDLESKTFIQLNKINADIIFYDQPYPWLPNNLLFYSTSKKSLICYIPYGFKIANAYQEHFNMFLQNCCWMLFAESDWHKDQFNKYSFMKGKNVIVSGYPKLDSYNEKWVVVKNNNFKKTIIWAPHWSIGKSDTSYSTFKLNHEYFMYLSKSYKEIFWIFKPHQRLEYYIEELNYMTKNEIKKYYDFWNSSDNTQYFDESNYFDIFKSSDALITDCGSFLAEYLPTKKPIMLLVNPKSSGYNEIGEKLVSSYYKAYKNNDIKDFIDNIVLNGNDYMLSNRVNNLYLVQPNKEGAGKFIVNLIDHKLSEQND